MFIIFLGIYSSLLKYVIQGKKMNIIFVVVLYIVIPYSSARIQTIDLYTGIMNITLFYNLCHQY